MIYNTGETNETLKAEYNPEGSVLRKAQYRMLEMLDYFASVCEKLDIPWRLESGNVLGAVRHEGFIPWDDDVDVVIRKEDESKLCKYLLKHPHHQFVLQCHKTDPHFYNPWTVLRDLKSEYIQNSAMHNARKFRGLQIDIFTEQRGAIAPLFLLAKKITALNNNFLVGRVKLLPTVVFYLQRYIIHPAFTTISKIFGNKKKCSYSYGIYWWDHTYPENVVYPFSQLKYEGRIYPGPANPDTFLKTIYGENYMQLPKKESRNHHLASYRVDD